MASSVNLETPTNAYQHVAKVLPDAEGVIAAVTKYRQSTVGRCVRGLLSRLTRTLGLPDIPRSVAAEEHQPSCFGLEEERGEGWNGSGVMGPAINEARPSL